MGVDRIIKMLRLTKVADSPIMMCSGGEKKRVNIGTELLTNPMVIMLDEPTSGLDSASAVSLLNVLKDLAKNHGKTIITTIHQPSSATFLNVFDNLLMLSDGNVVYFGTPTNSLDYLEDNGYACPNGYNAADHWMDLLVTDSSVEEERGGKTPRFYLQKAWDNEEVATRMDVVVDSIQPNNSNVATKAKEDSKYVTSWWTQFTTLTSRALKKNKMTVLAPINIIKTILLSVVTGVVYFNLHYTEKDVHNVFAYFFLVMLTWIMMSMGNAVFTFPQDRVVIQKERATASYRLSSYFLAMTVADLPVTLIMPALYMLISYWMVAWSFGFVTFVLIALIAMVGVMNGQAFGYLIGAALDDVQIGQTVMMVVMSLLMLVGGFFNPDIPSWLVWAQYLSPFYYAGNAAMQVIFKKNIPCDESGVYPQYCTGDETSIPAETYLQDVLKIKEPIWINLCVLFLFIVVPRILAYVVLRRKKAGERE